MAVVVAVVALVLAPTAAGSAAPGSPGGFLDGVQAGPGGVRVWGWTFDPDDAIAPADVHIYVGNQGVAVRADEVRSDVGAVYAWAGPKHGFDAIIPAPPGNHRVCAYGINVGPGHHTLLGCLDVTVGGSPIGAFDVAMQRPSGLHVAGWTIDPDLATPTVVHVYHRGGFEAFRPGAPAAASVHVAGGDRPDVGAIFPFHGPGHGFALDLPAVEGPNEVCVYAINSAGPGNHVFLGCRQLFVFTEILGSVETIERTSEGLRFAGWALDPHSDDAVSVSFTVDGVTASGTAGLAHLLPQVLVDGGYTNRHGFDVTVAAGQSFGYHDVCVDIANVAGTPGSDVHDCTQILVDVDGVEVVPPSMAAARRSGAPPADRPLPGAPGTWFPAGR